MKSSCGANINSHQPEKNLFHQYGSERKNIICSDTNLNPKTRDSWKQLAINSGYHYDEKRLDKPVGKESFIPSMGDYTHQVDLYLQLL